MRTRLILLFLSMLTGVLIHAQDLSVIGNPGGTASAISLSKLSSYFKGEIKTWDNGSKVVLALMKSNTAPGVSTCGKVFQMSCDAVTKFWLGKAMESNTAAPVFFNSVGELQAFVKSKPGAIGIIDLSPPVAGVRVIQIDGKNSF